MRGKSRREFSGTSDSGSYVRYGKQNVQGGERGLNSSFVRGPRELLVLFYFI